MVDVVAGESRDPVLDPRGAHDLAVAPLGLVLAERCRRRARRSAAAGRPMVVTRRTVSPYCRIETCCPDHVRRSVEPRVSRVGDVDVVHVGAAAARRGRTPRVPSSCSRCCSAGRGRRRAAGRRRTSTTGSLQSASWRGSLPVTSVITRCRPSRTRTTSRPSVFATSGSSTSASWVLVPVGPLPTAFSESAATRRAGHVLGHHRHVPARPSPTGRPGRGCGRRTSPAARRSPRSAPAPSACAGGADGSETTRAADVASRPAATMPPIARVEMRLPPRAVFAGVSMCLGRRVGRPGSVRTRWGRIGGCLLKATPVSSTSSSSEPPASPAS